MTRYGTDATHPSVDSDEDKYAKHGKGAKEMAGEALGKYRTALGEASLNGITDKHVYAFFRSFFGAYTIFLIVGLVVYECLGGSLWNAPGPSKARLFGAIAEGFGLLMLRYKIQKAQNVEGISAMTIIMYAVVYVIRQFDIPTFTLTAVNDWAFEVLAFVALLMVFDVLYSIFGRYKKTYQEDLDVLSVKYLIPGAFFGALLIRPSFVEGSWYSYSLAANMYLDTMALMPQIFMMQRSGGKIQAPIAHFVAATALSKGCDLLFWCENLHADFYVYGDVWSGWMMIFAHVVMLGLIGDFIYHYVKARMAGQSLTQDLDLSEECSV